MSRTSPRSSMHSRGDDDKLNILPTLSHLLEAITGNDVSLPLAKRLIASSMGTSPSSSDTLEATLRRMERQGADAATAREHHEALCILQEFSPSGREMADKILHVFSKLAGTSQEDLGAPSSMKEPAHHESTDVVTRSARDHVNAHSQQKEQTPDLINTENELLLQLEKEENLLLRECVRALLHGIDGDRMVFDKTGQNISTVIMHPNLLSFQAAESMNWDVPHRSILGSGAKDAVRIVAELGWLLQRIQHYIDTTKNDVSRGAIVQALALALEEHVNEYRSFLADIVLDQLPGRNHISSLRHLLVHIRQNPISSQQLRTLALVTDGVSHLTGGPLLTALHKHTQHGDSRHTLMVQKLTSRACVPWFDLLFQWTVEGELVDYDLRDFFVVEQQQQVRDMENMWHEQYVLDEEKVPMGILDLDLARQVLMVGKGINYIRTCLSDSEWCFSFMTKVGSKSDGFDRADGGDDIAEESTRQRLGFHYDPTGNGQITGSALRRTLSMMASQAHSHIIKSLHEEHDLMQHLWALKLFLFLGQGDFFAALMDGLHSEDWGRRPSRHSLTGVVETSIRDSNARYLPSSVLKRLQIELDLDKIPEYDPISMDDEAGDAWWDAFTLTYNVSVPLSAIVHPRALNHYKLVFGLLFRLKRVEYLLNSTWRQSTALNHAIHRQRNVQGGLKAGDSKRQANLVSASIILRKLSMTRQSLVHLLNNLQRYFMFEVLEDGWKTLTRNIQGAKTLDEVIQAHDLYLSEIVRKSLLDYAEEDNENTKGSRNHVVKRMLQACQEFCTFQDTLFKEALDWLDRAAQKRREAQRRIDEGHWGYDQDGDKINDLDILTLWGTSFSASSSEAGVDDSDYRDSLDIQSRDALLEKVDYLSTKCDDSIRALLLTLHEKVNETVLSTEEQSPRPSSRPDQFSSGNARATASSLPDRDNSSLRFLTFQLDYSDFYRDRTTKHSS